MPNSHHPTIESMYKVYLGVHDKSTAVRATTTFAPLNFNASSTMTTSDGDPWNSQMKRVARIRIHPGFNAANKLNDLAMLILADEVEMVSSVQNACLPPSTLSPDGRFEEAWMREGWIVGWGSLVEGGPMTNWLRNARVDIYDGHRCDNVVKEYRKNWNLQICAGNDGGFV